MPLESKEKPDICNRTFLFALRIIKLSTALRTNRQYSLADQVLRSGTSIGANVEEAQDAATRKDFIKSMVIALKEARETNYWLRLFLEGKLISKEVLEPIIEEVIQIIRILTAIVKTSKKNS